MKLLRNIYGWVLFLLLMVAPAAVSIGLALGLMFLLSNVIPPLVGAILSFGCLVGGVAFYLWMFNGFSTKRSPIPPRGS